MSTVRINVGAAANDGTGDTLRVAGQKVNTALDEIDAKDADQDAAIAAIHGVPAGGTTGQVLKKVSNADHDVHWAADETGGGGGGGGGLPAGGTVGQVLTKNSSTDGDASWVTPSGGGGASNLNAIVHVPTLAQFATQYDAAQSGGVAASTFIDNAGEGIIGIGPASDANTMSWRARDLPVDVSTNAFRIAARMRLYQPLNEYEALPAIAACIDASQAMFFGPLFPWSGEGSNQGRFYIAHFNSGYHDDEYSVVIKHCPEWYSMHFKGDGTVDFDISLDGRNWLTIYTKNMASLFGFTPTKYGFGFKPYHAPSQFIMPVFYSDEAGFTAP